MLKTSLMILLVVTPLLALHLSANAQTAQDPKQAERIKGQVTALGEGTRISVRLRDKRKVVGDLNYIGSDSFTMTDAKTNTSQKLAYTDVVQVERKAAHGFPMWGKIVIGVVVVLAVMGAIANGGG